MKNLRSPEYQPVHRAFSSGFTLIELLVVIAIIGILASIILGALSTAQSKGTAAAIEEELSGTRNQAEIYSGATTAVSGGTCATGSANLFGTANNGLGTILNGVNGSLNGFTSTNSYCIYAGTNLPEDGGQWAVAVSLPGGGTAAYWCVDSSGRSRSINASGAQYNGLTTGTAPAITGNGCS